MFSHPRLKLCMENPNALLQWPTLRLRTSRFLEISNSRSLLAQGPNTHPTFQANAFIHLSSIEVKKREVYLHILPCQHLTCMF